MTRDETLKALAEAAANFTLQTRQLGVRVTGLEVDLESYDLIRNLPRDTHLVFDRPLKDRISMELVGMEILRKTDPY